MKINRIDGNLTRIIEENFRKGERTFHHIKDYSIGGKVYHLYKVTFNEGTDMEHSTFELFKQHIRQKGSKDTHSDEEYTHYECYPSDDCFGNWAWCLTSEKRSDEKAMELGC